MLAAVLVASCSSGNEDDPAKDMEKPDFTDGELPSPLDCEVYHKGETISFPIYLYGQPGTGQL